MEVYLWRVVMLRDRLWPIAIITICSLVTVAWMCVLRLSDLGFAIVQIGERLF